MLVLTRKFAESIVIDGRVTLTVLRIDGDTVKIGVTAPDDVPVHRGEVYEEIQMSNRQAVLSPGASARIISEEWRSSRAAGSASDPSTHATP